MTHDIDSFYALKSGINTVGHKLSSINFAQFINVLRKLMASFNAIIGRSIYYTAFYQYFIFRQIDKLN